MFPAQRGQIQEVATSVLEALGLRETGEQRTALLGRLERSDRAWVHQVKGTESDFHRVVGSAERILTYAGRP